MRQSFFLEFTVGFLDDILGDGQFDYNKATHIDLDKLTLFPSKKRKAREQERLLREKYPQVKGGDTGQDGGQTYWVEHKDTDGSNIGWLKFDKGTNQLWVPEGRKGKPMKLGYPNEGYQRRPEGPSKSQGQSSFQRNTVDWNKTPQGKHHQKQIDQLTKKIEKSKEQEQAWYKNKFPMLSAKQKQEEKLILMQQNVRRMQDTGKITKPKRKPKKKKDEYIIW